MSRNDLPKLQDRIRTADLSPREVQDACEDHEGRIRDIEAVLGDELSAVRERREQDAKDRKEEKQRVQTLRDGVPLDRTSSGTGEFPGSEQPVARDPRTGLPLVSKDGRPLPAGVVRRDDGVLLRVSDGTVFHWDDDVKDPTPPANPPRRTAAETRQDQIDRENDTAARPGRDVEGDTGPHRGKNRR